jgi:protoporphyrinogen/coproporphyrinogen III oxidase
MADTNNVVVIGGGISGLACAYRLRQMGVTVTVLEAQPQAGGLIDTIEKDAFLFESGPQSFQGTGVLLALIRELEIESELCIADPKAPRFILRHGKLQKVPMSPQALLTGSLLAAGSRWKVASEPLRRTKPPAQEESVADFVRRKFGNEILEYLVAPFVSGVYAGDPEKLSLKAAFPSLEEWERKYGSVLRGAIKSRPAAGQPKHPSLCAFRRGVATLSRTLAGKLQSDLRVRARVEAVGRDASFPPSGSNEHPGYEIHFQRDGKAERLTARGVVMATPAYTAAHLLNSVSQQLAHTLSGIPYAGVAVVAAGYDSHQLGPALEGFGFLVPRSENRRTLGTVWNSSLFPGRAPLGSFTITSFVGGATEPEMLLKPSEEIAAIVKDENARILGIAGPPVASAVWKHPKALPQYNLGHAHIVEAIHDGEKETPGLFFSGNYLEGPSLGKCVENGFKTAEAMQEFLKKAPGS